ncbi:MAG: ATP-binding protein [Candidatus Thorarchaeota archaeon]|jgi:PAS domain S-box-containing protein
MVDRNNEAVFLRLRSYLIPIVIPVLALFQTFAYYQLFEPRVESADIGDALIYTAMASLVYLLILLFQRSVEKRLARHLLQLGWALVFFGAVHYGVIQLVDLSYPFNSDLPTAFVLAYQDNLTVYFGSGILLSFVGVYYWVADIRARERRFDSIVSAMPVGVAVTDLSGKVIFHNETLSQILGINRSHIQNSSLYDLLGVDVAESTDTIRTETNSALQMDVVLEDEGVQSRFLSVVVVENKDREGKRIGHIIVITDVSQKRAIENEREQARRVIDLYGSLLTHDIGNDLQAVLGYVEGAILLLEGYPLKAKDMLDSAQAASHRMSNLVKTFKIESIPKHVNVVTVLREAAERAEKASMGMTVTVETGTDTEKLRSPGGTLLPVAFDNLLRNVTQHAGNDPVVKIKAHSMDDTIVIVLADNGPGIPPAVQSTLFNRGDPSREKGLGLYLTKQIVTACGGTITLDTDPDLTGAAFRITLPIIE